jgi:nicotinate-nucleotide adenylyltransferase
LGRLVPPLVGLLGGSFNPAHEGHLHVSLEALKRLGLDEIWWLVAPQNPLKPVDGMAPFAERLGNARKFANDKRIRVLDLETRLGTIYTLDTLRALRRLYPGQVFVWLMGADNLAQIRYWRGWEEIFRLVPIAVVARPTYCLRALAGMAAQRFARYRIRPEQARLLARTKPPAWVFLPVRLDASSASEIRSHAKGQRASKRR